MDLEYGTEYKLPGEYYLKKAKKETAKSVNKSIDKGLNKLLD